MARSSLTGMSFKAVRCPLVRETLPSPFPPFPHRLAAVPSLYVSDYELLEDKVFVSLVFSNSAWCLAFKDSINVGRTKKRKKEGKKREVGGWGRGRKGPSARREVTGNEVKLEQDCEEIQHDSMGSMGSLKLVKQKVTSSGLGKQYSKDSLF